MKLRRLPGPPPVFLLGNALQMAKAPVHQQLTKWEELYGKVYKLEFPGVAAVVLTDPEEIVRITKGEKWEKFTLVYRNLEKMTMDTHPNFLTEPMGPYYKALRKAVTPAFSSANLRQFLPMVLELTDSVTSYLAAHGEAVPVDMDQAAQRLTIDVIGRFAFDRAFGATGFGRNEALLAVHELMMTTQRMNNPFNRWFWWRKEARDQWAARCRFHKLVAAALEDLREQPPAPHCLLAYLLNMTDPRTGKPLSPKKLRCETALFWIAGFETTAHAIGWSLMFIASDPQVQDRVAQELDAVGLLATASRPQPRPVAWSDLGALQYLNAVIYEALRLMPPTPSGTAREAPMDAKLAGYDIPKGSMIMIPFYALQRSTRVWGPDATQFRPERWLAGGSGAAAVAGGRGCDGNGAFIEEVSPPSPTGVLSTSPTLTAADMDEVVKAAATQTARGWMPFSEGPRNCVGQSLAMMELRVALATWCGRFRFRLADEMGGVEGAVAESRQHLTLKPGPKGLLMHVTQRVPS